MNRHVASTVGERIASARRRRGIARQTLADLIGRSAEWLRQVETGQRKLDSIECAVRIAEVLDFSDLLRAVGLRSENAVVRPEDGGAWIAVRRALLDSALLTAFPAESPRWAEAAATLQTDVARAWDGWLRPGDGRYARTVKALPGLLRGAAMYLRDEANAYRPEPAIEAYHLARTLLARIGQEQLGWLAADRAFRAAKRTGGPGVLAAAWHLAATYLGQGFRPEAEWLAMAAIRYDARPATPGELPILRGALYLLAAEAAASTLDTQRAEQLLDQAKHATDLVGGDKSARHILFGPTEVGLSAVEVAIQQGRVSEALHSAARVDMPDDYSIDRWVRYNASLAFLHSQRNEDGYAVLALTRIATLSPEDLRYDARVRRALQRLLRRKNSTVRGELNRLSRLADMT